MQSTSGLAFITEGGCGVGFSGINFTDDVSAELVFYSGENLAGL